MGGNCTKRLDLTGQRFGMLTVLHRAENIGRDTAWRCRCDCGNETVVRTCYLRKGRTRSCGCDTPSPLLAGTRQYDLTGRRFGKLTALKPLGAPNGRNHRWLCRCDCGGEMSAQVGNLRNGKTKSCGCDYVKISDKVHNIDGTSVELIRKNTLRSNNSSGVTGVEWLKRQQRWRASLCFKGERH